MHFIYVTKLSFCTRKIDISTQKINKSYLNIFEIIIADCLVNNKLKRVQFFLEIFLLANICINVVLRISFLNFKMANIQFIEQKLIWSTYKTTMALSKRRQVNIINKRKFVKAAINVNNKIFIIYITALANSVIMLIYFFRKAQVALLISTKTFIEDSNFSNIFFSHSAMKLPKYTRIYNYSIDLLDNEKLP